MPRPKTFGETLYIRVPRGIRAEVEVLRAKESQADFLRRLLLKALAEERATRNGKNGATSPAA